VHAPYEDKSDDTKDSFHEEPERELDQFPTYHVKVLFGDYNKIGQRIYFQTKNREWEFI
jgi:hypothetical protein